MKKFITFFLQFLAIVSAMLLLATMFYIKFGYGVITMPEWLEKLLTVNCFVEPTLCVIALVALGDMKRSERKKNTRMFVKGDNNVQLSDFPAEDPRFGGYTFVSRTKEDDGKGENTPDGK